MLSIIIIYYYYLFSCCLDLSRHFIRNSVESLEKHFEVKKEFDTLFNKREKRIKFYEDLKNERMEKNIKKLKILNDVMMLSNNEGTILLLDDKTDNMVDKNNASISNEECDDVNYKKSQNSPNLMNLSVINIKVKISYIKPALRFGWRKDEIYMSKNWREYLNGNISYYNDVLKERSEMFLSYSAEEDSAARKIQLKYLICKTRKLIKKKITSRDIEKTVLNCINKCSELGYIGYKNEGLTVFQLLCRLGHCDIVKTIQKYFRLKYPSIYKNTKNNKNTKNAPNICILDDSVSADYSTFKEDNIDNADSKLSGSDDGKSCFDKSANSDGNDDKNNKSDGNYNSNNNSSKNREIVIGENVRDNTNKKPMKNNDQTHSLTSTNHNNSSDLHKRKPPQARTKVIVSTPTRTRTRTRTNTHTTPVKSKNTGSVSTSEKTKPINTNTPTHTSNATLNSGTTPNTKSENTKYSQKSVPMTYEKAIQQLTFLDIIDLPLSKYESLGVTDVNSVRSLRDLQSWWLRSNPSSQEYGFSLINGYVDYNDARTMRTCIQDSYEDIVSKFIKIFPSGQSRTREACTVLTESHYPISRRQLEAYLKKYSVKAELARVC